MISLGWCILVIAKKPLGLWKYLTRCRPKPYSVHQGTWSLVSSGMNHDLLYGLSFLISQIVIFHVCPCLDSSVFTSKEAVLSFHMLGFSSSKWQWSYIFQQGGTVNTAFLVGGSLGTLDIFDHFDTNHPSLPSSCCCAFQKPATVHGSVTCLGSESAFSPLFTGKLQSLCFLGPVCISSLFNPTVMKWKIPSQGCQWYRRINKRLSFRVTSGKVFYYFGYGFYVRLENSFSLISFILEDLPSVFQLLFWTQSF